MDIPGPLHHLERRLQSLLQEKRSLELAKSIAGKEASTIINEDLYQQLILLNEHNRELRKSYKELMKDRQLKKENYYQDKKSESSLRGSGIFSFSTSAVKAEHLTTPKNGYSRAALHVQPEERKSFCPLRRNAVSHRESFGTKSKALKNSDETFKSGNIFLNLFSVIVEEERQTEKELANYFGRHKTECANVMGAGIHLADMEKHLQQSLLKIEKMMELMRLYQDKLDKSTRECDELQKTITQFAEAKQRLGSIYEKIRAIPEIEKEISIKREYL